MAVTEPAKHDLYTYLEETMGQERATTLMAMISPTGWADVATKQDLEHQTAALRADLGLLRADLEHQTAALRADLEHQTAALRGELQHETALLRGELQELRIEMAQFVTKADFEKGLRVHSLATATFTSLFMGIAVTLARAM